MSSWRDIEATSVFQNADPQTRSSMHDVWWNRQLSSLPPEELTNTQTLYRTLAQYDAQRQQIDLRNKKDELATQAAEAENAGQTVDYLALAQQLKPIQEEGGLEQTRRFLDRLLLNSFLPKSDDPPDDRPWILKTETDINKQERTVLNPSFVRQGDEVQLNSHLGELGTSPRERIEALLGFQKARQEVESRLVAPLFTPDEGGTALVEEKETPVEQRGISMGGGPLTGTTKYDLILGGNLVQQTSEHPEFVLSQFKKNEYREKGGSSQALFANPDSDTFKAAKTRFLEYMANTGLPAIGEEQVAQEIAQNPDGNVANSLVQTYIDRAKASLWVDGKYAKDAFEKVRLSSTGDALINPSWSMEVGEGEILDELKAAGLSDQDAKRELDKNRESREVQSKKAVETAIAFRDPSDPTKYASPFSAVGGAIYESSLAKFAAENPEILQQENGYTKLVDAWKSERGAFTTGLDAFRTGAASGGVSVLQIKYALGTALGSDDEAEDLLAANEVMSNLAMFDQTPLQLVSAIGRETPLLLATAVAGPAALRLRYVGSSAVNRAIGQAAARAGVRAASARISGEAVEQAATSGWTRMLQTFNPTSVPGAVYFTGQALRSGGAVYGEAYQTMYERGLATGLSEEEARESARYQAVVPAVAATAVTAALMKLIPGGTEKIFASTAGTNVLKRINTLASSIKGRRALELVQDKAFRKEFANAILKPIFVEGVQESVEEGFDEAIQGVIRTTYDESTTLDDILYGAAHAALIGGVIGGGVNAIRTPRLLRQARKNIEKVEKQRQELLQARPDVRAAQNLASGTSNTAQAAREVLNQVFNGQLSEARQEAIDQTTKTAAETQEADQTEEEEARERAAAKADEDAPSASSYTGLKLTELNTQLEQLDRERVQVAKDLESGATTPEEAYEILNRLVVAKTQIQAEISRQKFEANKQKQLQGKQIDEEFSKSGITEDEEDEAIAQQVFGKSLDQLTPEEVSGMALYRGITRMSFRLRDTYLDKEIITASGATRSSAEVNRRSTEARILRARQALASGDLAVLQDLYTKARAATGKARKDPLKETAFRDLNMPSATVVLKRLERGDVENLFAPYEQQRDGTQKAAATAAPAAPEVKPKEKSKRAQMEEAFAAFAPAYISQQLRETGEVPTLEQVSQAFASQPEVNPDEYRKLNPRVSSAYRAARTDAINDSITQISTRVQTGEVTQEDADAEIQRLEAMKPPLPGVRAPRVSTAAPAAPATPITPTFRAAQEPQEPAGQQQRPQTDEGGIPSETGRGDRARRGQKAPSSIQENDLDDQTVETDEWIETDEVQDLISKTAESGQRPITAEQRSEISQQVAKLAPREAKNPAKKVFERIRDAIAVRYPRAAPTGLETQRRDGGPKSRSAYPVTVRQTEQGEVLEGVFTNDSIVTARQLNDGVQVVVPPELRNNVNPNIQVDEQTGVVLSAQSEYGRVTSPGNSESMGLPTLSDLHKSNIKPRRGAPDETARNLRANAAVTIAEKIFRKLGMSSWLTVSVPATGDRPGAVATGMAAVFDKLSRAVSNTLNNIRLVNVNPEVVADELKRVSNDQFRALASRLVFTSIYQRLTARGLTPGSSSLEEMKAQFTPEELRSIADFVRETDSKVNRPAKGVAYVTKSMRTAVANEQTDNAIVDIVLNKVFGSAAAENVYNKDADSVIREITFNLARTFPSQVKRVTEKKAREGGRAVETEEGVAGATKDQLRQQIDNVENLEDERTAETPNPETGRDAADVGQQDAARQRLVELGVPADKVAIAADPAQALQILERLEGLMRDATGNPNYSMEEDGVVEALRTLYELAEQNSQVSAALTELSNSLSSASRQRNSRAAEQERLDADEQAARSAAVEYTEEESREIVEESERVLDTFTPNGMITRETLIQIIEDPTTLEEHRYAAQLILATGVDINLFVIPDKTMPQAGQYIPASKANGNRASVRIGMSAFKLRGTRDTIVHEVLHHTLDHLVQTQPDVRRRLIRLRNIGREAFEDIQENYELALALMEDSLREEVLGLTPRQLRAILRELKISVSSDINLNQLRSLVFAELSKKSGLLESTETYRDIRYALYDTDNDDDAGSTSPDELNVEFITQFLTIRSVQGFFKNIDLTSQRLGRPMNGFQAFIRNVARAFTQQPRVGQAEEDVFTTLLELVPEENRKMVSRSRASRFRAHLFRALGTSAIVNEEATEDDLDISEDGHPNRIATSETFYESTTLTSETSYVEFSMQGDMATDEQLQTAGVLEETVNPTPESVKKASGFTGQLTVPKALRSKKASLVKKLGLIEAALREVTGYTGPMPPIVLMTVPKYKAWTAGVRVLPDGSRYMAVTADPESVALLTGNARRDSYYAALNGMADSMARAMMLGRVMESGDMVSSNLGLEMSVSMSSPAAEVVGFPASMMNRFRYVMSESTTTLDESAFAAAARATAMIQTMDKRTASERRRGRANTALEEMFFNHPLVDMIGIGGMLSPTIGRKDERLQSSFEEFDGWPTRNPVFNRIFTNSTSANRPDQWASEAYAAGLIREESVTALWSELMKAAKSASDYAKNIKGEMDRMKRYEAFAELNEGGEEMFASELMMGDTFKVGGKPFKVYSRRIDDDGYVEEVIIQGPPKYDTIALTANDRVFVSDLKRTSVEVIDENNPFSRASRTALPFAVLNRHAELEAKFNAGTITPEETAEAKAIVAKAAQVTGYGTRAHHGLANEKLEGNSYDVSRRGSNTGAASAALGFFFSAGRQTASSYTKPIKIKSSEISKRVLGDITEIVDWVEFRTRNNKDGADYKKAKDTQALLRSLKSGSLTYDQFNSIGNAIADWTSQLVGDGAILSDEFDLNAKAIRTQSELNFILDQASSRTPVLDTFLRLSNPLVYDMNYSEYRERTYFDIIQEAKERGHDGVIIKNTFDGGPIDDIYVVFDPNQIKSAEPFTGVPLDQRFDVASPDIRFSRAAQTPGDSSDELTRTLSGELGMGSKKRMVRLLVENLYNADLSDTINKEILQNSFDAIKDAQAEGLLASDDGVIIVAQSSTEDEYILRVVDNGRGMSTDTVLNAFLKVGGTRKGAGKHSGGKGLAKMALFHASSRIVLSTTRDGVRTSFDVTTDILTDDENGTFPIEVTQAAPSAINGTSVTLYIPKKIITSSDEEKTFTPTSVPSDMIMADLDIYGAKKYARLDADSPLIEDFLEGRQSSFWDRLSDTDRIIYKPFTPATFEDLESVGFTKETFTVDGVTVDVRFKRLGLKQADGSDLYSQTFPIKNKSNITVYNSTLQVFSNELFQFKQDTPNLNPLELFGDKLPYAVFVNVDASAVDAASKLYPFTNSRESFVKGHPVKARLEAILDRLIAEERARQLENEFGLRQLVGVESQRISSDQPLHEIPVIYNNTTVEMSPEERLAMETMSIAVFDAMDDVVRMLQIYDREEVPGTGRSTLESLSLLDEGEIHEWAVVELKKNRSSFGSVKSEFRTSLQEAADDDTLKQRLIEKFSTLSSYRQGKLNEAMASPKQYHYGVGLSKNWSGVNVNGEKPLSLLNPVYNPNVFALPTILAARKMFHTTFHEVIHHHVRSEGQRFTWAMGYVESLVTESGIQEHYVARYNQILLDHADAFASLAKKLEQAETLDPDAELSPQYNFKPDNQALVSERGGGTGGWTVEHEGLVFADAVYAGAESFDTLPESAGGRATNYAPTSEVTLRDGVENSLRRLGRFSRAARPGPSLLQFGTGTPADLDRVVNYSGTYPTKKDLAMRLTKATLAQLSIQDAGELYRAVSLIEGVDPASVSVSTLDLIRNTVSELVYRTLNFDSAKDPDLVDELTQKRLLSPMTTFLSTAESILTKAANTATGTHLQQIITDATFIRNMVNRLNGPVGQFTGTGAAGTPSNPIQDAYGQRTRPESKKLKPLTALKKVGIVKRSRLKDIRDTKFTTGRPRLDEEFRKTRATVASIRKHYGRQSAPTQLALIQLLTRSPQEAARLGKSIGLSQSQISDLREAIPVVSNSKLETMTSAEPIIEALVYFNEALIMYRDTLMAPGGYVELLQSNADQASLDSAMRSAQDSLVSVLASSPRLSSGSWSGTPRNPVKFIRYIFEGFKFVLSEAQKSYLAFYSQGAGDLQFMAAGSESMAFRNIDDELVYKIGLLQPQMFGIPAFNLQMNVESIDKPGMMNLGTRTIKLGWDEISADPRGGILDLIEERHTSTPGVVDTELVGITEFGAPITIQKFAGDSTSGQMAEFDIKNPVHQKALEDWAELHNAAYIFSRNFKYDAELTPPALETSVISRTHSGKYQLLLDIRKNNAYVDEATGVFYLFDYIAVPLSSKQINAVPEFRDAKDRIEQRIQKFSRSAQRRPLIAKLAFGTGTFGDVFKSRHDYGQFKTGFARLFSTSGKFGPKVFEFVRDVEKEIAATETFAEMWLKEYEARIADLGYTNSVPQNIVDDFNTLLGDVDMSIDESLKKAAVAKRKKAVQQANQIFSGIMAAAQPLKAPATMGKYQLVKAQAKATQTAALAQAKADYELDMENAVLASQNAFRQKQAQAMVRLDASTSPEFVNLALEMRGRIDMLSERLLALGLDDYDLNVRISNNKSVYLSRTYEMHDDPYYLDWLENSNESEAVRLRDVATQFFRKNAIKNEYKRVRERYKAINKVSKIDRQTAKILKAAAIKSVTDDVVLDMLKDYLSQHAQNVKDGGNNVRVGGASTDILLDRTDIPKELREVLGQYTDNRQNAIRTLANLTAVVANREMYSKVHDFLMNAQLITSNRNEAREKGLVPFNVDPATSKILGKLQGMYGPPLLVEAFNELKPLEVGPAGQWWRTLVVQSMKAATVQSLRTAIRNVLANPLMALNAGHGLDALSELFSKRYRSAAAYDTPGQIAARARILAEEYARLGVTGGNIDLESIRASLEPAGLSGRSPFVFMAGKFAELLKLGQWGKRGAEALAKIPAALDTKAEEFYQWGDDVWKRAVYEAELNDYAKAFNLTLENGDYSTVGLSTAEVDRIIQAMTALNVVDPGSPLFNLPARAQAVELLKRKAAQQTRVVMPYYETAFYGIRQAKRYGITSVLAPFISFHAEMLRVFAMNPVSIVRDLRVPELRSIALKRAAGYLQAQVLGSSFAALQIGLVYSIYQALLWAFGGDDEEEPEKQFQDFEGDEDAAEEHAKALLPDYYQKMDIQILGKQGNNPVVADVTWANPYSSNARMIKALFSGDIPEFVTSLLGPGLNFQIILDTVSREKDTISQAIDEGSLDFERVLESTKNVGAVLIPKTARDFFNIGSVVFKGTTTTGVESDTLRETVSFLSGSKFVTMDLDQLARRKFGKASRIIGQDLDSQDFRKAVKSPTSTSPEQWDSLIADMNETRRKQFIEVKKAFDALSFFAGQEVAMDMLNSYRGGMSRDALNAALNGVYIKAGVSEQTVNDAIRMGERRGDTRLKDLTDAWDRYPTHQPLFKNDEE